MRGKIVCALFAVGCCAFGHGLARAVPEAARQACAKVPEEHREAVGSEIREMAYTEATREAGEKFGLLIMPDAWTNVCGKGVLLKKFVGNNFYKYAPDGRLVQFGSETNFEELAWCDRRRDELVVQFWNDRAVIDAALSNVVASANEARLGGRASFPSFNRPLRLTAQPQLGLLEELVPLEEAMALAKAGKGKGFYQLALRYARGEGLPKDDAVAYRMLCKARDADYAHAVLVEGLCDEIFLRQPQKRFGRRLFLNGDAREALRSYCGGADFRDGRNWDEHDYLTNAVAVARVMGKYEKAKRLGALVATNQIAALNKCLSDFKTEVAKRAQTEMLAEANNRRVMVLLGEDVRKETDAAAAERERAAAECEQQRQELLRIQAELRRQREQRKLERPRRQQEEVQTAAPVAPGRSSLANLRARRAQKETEREEEARRQLRDERMSLLPKYRAAFKDLTGYEMGQRVGEELLDRKCSKNVKLEKPYRYFTDCELQCYGGCLYGVSMFFRSNWKYSRKSLEAEAEAVRKDLAGRFGVEVDSIGKGVLPSRLCRRGTGSSGSGLRLAVSAREDGIWLSISDEVLAKELRMRLEEKREAQKEVLPVFDEIGKK